MKRIYIMLCILLCVTVYEASAIQLYTWDVAPYNIGIGNVYQDLEGVKVIKQRIITGDCVYPTWLDPIVYSYPGKFADYKVTRNYIEIPVNNAQAIQVFIFANSKTKCTIGTKYVMDKGWLSLKNEKIDFKYDYLTEWVPLITSRQ